MPEGTYDVLFLCTGNSARSILAECILNRLGGGRFQAHSAGSQPKGEVHPMALELLDSLGYDTQDLRSKSWDKFALSGAPDLDFVFTVCGNAANEVCPIWSGQPIGAHWGIEDPAAVTGPPEQQLKAFKTAYSQLERRIQAFTKLPLTSLDKPALQTRLKDIGKMSDHQDAIT